MITGDTQAAFLNVASTAAQVRAGKLKPIAVVNHERLPDYPDVPTMAEVGFPDVGTIAWNAMFAPAATPKPVLETLHKAAVDGPGGAGRQGGADQAELQHRAVEVGGRGEDLARRRDRDLEEDHRRGEDRDRGVRRAPVPDRHPDGRPRLACAGLRRMTGTAPGRRPSTRPRLERQGRTSE